MPHNIVRCCPKNHYSKNIMYGIIILYKNVVIKNVKNGRTDFLVKIIELLRFLNRTKLLKESSSLKSIGQF